MTWNVKAFELQFDGVVRVIGNQKPDVVGLQEVCVAQLEDIRSALRERYKLRYRMQPGSVFRTDKCPSGTAYGEGMLSKRKMTRFSQTKFPVQEGKEPRQMMAVTIKLGRRSVRVFNTHIGLGREIEPQIKTVARITRRHRRALVLGDFNADPTRPEIAPMFRAFNEDRNGPWTFNHQGNLVKIDYVFRRGIKFIRQRAYDTPSSDHRPFVVDVRRP